MAQVIRKCVSMKTLLVFLLIFSIIVVIHEFGHFYFARRAGIRVREFSIGMGPKLFAHQGKDHTAYTIRMLPLGGYVRLAGLNEEEDLQAGMEVSLAFNDQNQVTLINKSKKSGQDELPVRINDFDLLDDLTIEAIPVGQDVMQTYSVSDQALLVEEDGTKIPLAPRSMRYESASVWHKFLTNMAGPLNNFILSILIYTLIAFLLPGVPVGTTSGESQPVVGQVSQNSPAAAAGLQADDEIKAINGQTIETWEQLTQTIQDNGAKELSLTVERAGKDVQVQLTPEKADNDGGDPNRLVIGIMQKSNVSYDSSLGARLTYGFTQTWAVVTGIFGVLGSMLVSGFKLDNFGGPIAMAQMTNQVVSYGFTTILSFMAYISANLGVFNLLPIPALDGGKILLNLVEAVRGKPLSQSKEGIITLVGVFILFVFMIAVTWNDIQRAFFN